MKKYVAIAFLFLGFTSALLNYQGYEINFPELTPTSTGHRASQPTTYNNALQLQAAFVKNARELRPSVVSINNLQEIASKAHPRRESDLLGRLKGWLDRSLNRRFQMESLGSGIVLTSNGYILTNYHVVEETDRILVKMADGEDYTAKVIGVDEKTDLAVIKIFSLMGFPAAPIGVSEDLQVGEWVMAIGNPYGLEGTVTVGVISGIHRSDLGLATFENFIQTDASVNPGNSGGPLINLDGQVVGVNTAVAEIGAGVGFAIPIHMAVEIAEELIKEGEVARGWLGVGIQKLTPELAESFQVTTTNGGVVINSIQEGAPAEQGGLRRGDIIFDFNGEQVPDPKSLQRMVADTETGKQVPIRIWRQGREKMLQVTIGKYTS